MDSRFLVDLDRSIIQQLAMTEQPFTRDDLGNRVFVVWPDNWTDIEGGGLITTGKTYQSSAGKKSKYPTIILQPGDKVFVPHGKANVADPVYTSAINRKATDPAFDYTAYACKFRDVRGLMIRCVVRKSKQPT